MLVLSRKKNEQIVIGDCITVTVLEIVGNKVRLGIVADRGIPVHRKEIQRLVDTERKEVEQQNLDEYLKGTTHEHVSDASSQRNESFSDRA